MSKKKKRTRAKNLPYQEAGAKLLTVAGEHLKSGDEEVGLRSLTKEVGTSTNAVYSLYGSKDILFLAAAKQTFQEEYETPKEITVEAVTEQLHKVASKWPALFRATHATPSKVGATALTRPHVDPVALSATPLIVDQYMQALGGDKAEAEKWWRRVYSYLAGATLAGEMPTLEETLAVGAM